MSRSSRFRFAILGAVALAAAPLPLIAGPAGLPDQASTKTGSADAVAMRAQALQMLQQQPGNREALTLLSRIYQAFRAGGVTKAQEAQLRAAEIADYQVALAAYPDWPEALYRSAVHRIALHRLEPERVEELTAAIRELGKAAELSANAPATLRASILHQRGRAEKHLGDDILDKGGDAQAAERYFLQSLASFEDALSLAPERVDILGEVVLVERGRGRLVEALERLERAAPAVTRPLYRAKLWEMIGALRVEAGMDTAVEALQQALALNPKALGTYLTLAAWHRRGGDDSQAEAVLHQAISAIPTAVEAWKTLADLAVERGDPAAASGYWQKLLAVEAASATFVGMQPSRNLYRNSLYRDAALAVAENEWRRLGDRESAQKWLAVAARFGAMDDRGRRLMEAIAAGRQ